MRDLLEAEHKMVYYTRQGDSRARFLGLLLEEGPKCKVQPLPALYGPLPSPVTVLPMDMEECHDPVDVQKVLRSLEAAKLVSQARGEMLRTSMAGVKAKMEKEGRKPAVPKSKKAPVMAKRYKWIGGDLKLKGSGWASAIAAVVGKSKEPMTIAEIQAAVVRPESKMDTKVAVTWYCGDMAKKKILAEVK